MLFRPYLLLGTYRVQGGCKMMPGLQEEDTSVPGSKSLRDPKAGHLGWGG